MNINKVLFTGNLVRDPELTKVSEDTSLVKVDIANNDSYVTEGGDREKVVTFVQIQVWGKQAEALAQYGKKGQEIFVEGQLRYEQWNDKNGPHSRHVLRVERWQFTQYPKKD